MTFTTNTTQLGKDDKYTPPAEIVVIADVSLRNAIASQAGILGPTQVLLRPLTQKDLNELTALASSGKNIANLAGLNAATRLLSLNVANNPLQSGGIDVGEYSHTTAIVGGHSGLR